MTQTSTEKQVIKYKSHSEAQAGGGIYLNVRVTPWADGSGDVQVMELKLYTGETAYMFVHEEINGECGRISPQKLIAIIRDVCKSLNIGYVYEVFD